MKKRVMNCNFCVFVSLPQLKPESIRTYLWSDHLMTKQLNLIELLIITLMSIEVIIVLIIINNRALSKVWD